jgi:hypothetical protein
VAAPVCMVVSTDLLEMVLKAGVAQGGSQVCTFSKISVGSVCLRCLA